MTCSHPLEPSLLADYWLAALPATEEEAVEEHLLACDPCGARLREIIALAEAIGHLARDGSLRLIVTEAFLAHAAAQGTRIREYAVPPGGRVECTVTAEDHLLIARLAANVSSAAQVDLSLCDEHGVELRRLPAIPVQPGAGSVLFQESIPFAQALPTHQLIARLLSVDAAGRETLLGEYTFNHTRSLPGPGAWPPG